MKDRWERDWDKKMAAHNAKRKRLGLIFAAWMLLCLFLWPLFVYLGSYLAAMGWRAAGK